MKIGDLVKINNDNNRVGVIIKKDADVSSPVRWWFILYTNGDYSSAPEAHLVRV